MHAPRRLRRRGARQGQGPEAHGEWDTCDDGHRPANLRLIARFRALPPRRHNTDTQWRTVYVFLKDRIRTKLAKYDTARRTGSRIKIEELADKLQGDDEDRIEAVFGERASLFAGFMENADERRREGIDPDAHSKSRSKRRRREEENDLNEDDAEDDRDEEQDESDGEEPQVGDAEGEGSSKRARLEADHNDQQYEEQQEAQPGAPAQYGWQPGSYPYYNMNL